MTNKRKLIIIIINFYKMKATLSHLLRSTNDSVDPQVWFRNFYPLFEAKLKQKSFTDKISTPSSKESEIFGADLEFQPLYKDIFTPESPILFESSVVSSIDNNNHQKQETNSNFTLNSLRSECLRIFGMSDISDNIVKTLEKFVIDDFQLQSALFEIGL